MKYNVMNVPQSARELPYWTVRIIDSKMQFAGAYAFRCDAVAYAIEQDLMVIDNPQ